MTGGQKSPSTPLGANTKTSPWGSVDEPMEGAETAMCMGATYVARWTVAHPVQLSRSIESGIKHKGLSFIEVITPCPTQSGQEVYGSKDPSFIIDYLRDNSYIYKEGMPEIKGKIKCGILLHDNDRPEYIEKMMTRLGRFWTFKSLAEEE